MPPLTEEQQFPPDSVLFPFDNTVRLHAQHIRSSPLIITHYRGFQNLLYRWHDRDGRIIFEVEV